MQAHAVLLIVGCLIWQDGKFIIKTVSRKESKFLKHILPNYYNYAMSAENTLIPRFFGAPLPRASAERMRNATRPGG